VTGHTTVRWAAGATRPFAAWDLPQQPVSRPNRTLIYDCHKHVHARNHGARWREEGDRRGRCVLGRARSAGIPYPISTTTAPGSLYDMRERAARSCPRVAPHKAEDGVVKKLSELVVQEDLTK